MDILVPSIGRGLTSGREQHSERYQVLAFQVQFQSSNARGTNHEIGKRTPRIAAEIGLEGSLRVRFVQRDSKKLESSVCPARAGGSKVCASTDTAY